MKMIISVLIFFLLLITSSFAQVQQEWVARYGGPGNTEDAAASIVIDNAGNIYVTGYSYEEATNYDYATVKYNLVGEQLWVQRYNGSGNDSDYAAAIALDDSMNVFVTGSSKGSNTGYDYVTIKYDSAGVLKWSQRYDGSAYSTDYALSIAIDGSGNSYVSGYSKGYGTDFDYATIKYNSSGLQQWVQRYNGPGNSGDKAYSIAVDNFGNVYVTGGSYGIGTNEDYATIKYNSSGIQQWAQRYNGTGNDFDRTFSIAIDLNGNVYVTGTSVGNGTYNDYATIKYNPAGIQQWVSRYNGPGNYFDRANAIEVDNYGNSFVTGCSFQNGTNGDYATIKYDPNGESLWVKRYDGLGYGYDWSNSIALDDDGNIYITGYSYGYGSNSDYATIRYDSNGFQQWTERYNGTGNTSDYASLLLVDDWGNVYLTGGSFGTGSGMDYVTIKYSQPIGIKSVSNEIPKKYQLEQNYPNPFNPATKIKFAVPKSGEVKLVVYDMLGREVETLVSEHLKPGTYEADWNASQFSSGVYFYKLIANEFTQTKRMVLVK